MSERQKNKISTLIAETIFLKEQIENLTEEIAEEVPEEMRGERLRGFLRGLKENRYSGTEEAMKAFTGMIQQG